MTSAGNEAGHVALGALWMLGAVAFFTIMAIASRAAGGVYDTFEIMIYRSLIGLAVLLAFVAATGRTGQIGRGRMGLTVIRNSVHFVGQNLWLYALTVLPLAQVIAIEFTTPIWILLLGPLIVRESITRRGVIVAVIGFAGTLIVARPGFTLDPGLLAAAAAAVGFALANLCTRLLTRTETVVSILFWLHVIQATLGLIFAGMDGEIAPPRADMLLPLLAVGISGLAAHACLTTALSLAPAQRVAPVDFLRLPVSIAAGWWLYNEGIDLWVIIGSATILMANWLNLPRHIDRHPR